SLRDIHRRVGTAIFFESSGGMVDKVAHLPELRFALGEPDLDIASIDNAADALERRAFYLRKVGADGYRFGFRATLKKVVADRRASLDEQLDVRPAVRQMVKNEFARGANLPVVHFPEDGAAVPDTPQLTIVVMGPEFEWDGTEGPQARIAGWTQHRGPETRRYPAALVWCVKKPGRGLQDQVEGLLAWRRVADELRAGMLATLKTEGLFTESVGAGYLGRNWPVALRESGAWPLQGLRQSFLDGSLVRLVDPERTLREQIVRWVEAGEFGLASGQRSDGGFQRVWFKEPVRQEEITFDASTFLMTRDRATALTQPGQTPLPPIVVEGKQTAEPVVWPGQQPTTAFITLRIHGPLRPELWNRLGVKVLPKLIDTQRLDLRFDATVQVQTDQGSHLVQDIRQALAELGLADSVEVDLER